MQPFRNIDLYLDIFDLFTYLKKSAHAVTLLNEFNIS